MISKNIVASDPTRTYCVHPHLQHDEMADGRIELSIPFGRNKLRINPAISSKLQRLDPAGAHSTRTLVSIFGQIAVDTLVRYSFLLDPEDVEILADGLCIPASSASGTAIGVDQLASLQQDDVIVLHVPIQTTTELDVSVAAGGQWVRRSLAQTFFRPSAQRSTDHRVVDLDFYTDIDMERLRLFDLGNVIHHPTTESAHVVGTRAAYLCRKIVAADARPVLLGGDHSLAYYSIGALAERYPRVGVLQFDAHTDMYMTGSHADARLNHANVMCRVASMPHVASLWQIGVRDVFCQPTSMCPPAEREHVHVLSAYEAEVEGYDRLFQKMNRDLPWFVSFDVDALAGGECPDTATPVLGGLSFYRLLACFERLFREFNIVGMEFVELGDATPKAQGSAAIATRIISRFLFHIQASTHPPIHF